jgi:hypothetical protein
MGYSPRGIDGTSSQTAFGDCQFYEFVYAGAVGGCTLGKPLYVQVTDAAEYNSLYSGTALSPAVARSGGKVVLGTDATAGANLMCVGVFQPTDQNFALVPAVGDIVRVLAYGRGIVSAQSPAAGSAATVGGSIIASAAVTDAVPGTRATGLNLGVFLATGTHVTTGSQIFAAASATPTLVNAFVNLS